MDNNIFLFPIFIITYFIIIYIFFKFIELMKKVYTHKNLCTTRHFTKLNPQEILLGNINIEKLSSNHPNKFSYNLKPNLSLLPLNLILNGKIIHENLELIKKDSNWLIKTINKKEISNINIISLAILKPTGELYFKIK